MEDLLNRLDPARALNSVCDALGSTLTFDFAGVATLSEEGDRFDVVGAVKRTRDVDKATAGTFPRLGTAGSWALMTGLPFISESLRNVGKFPQTHRDMERHSMASNAVIPLQSSVGRPSLLYFLSRRSNGSWLEQVGLFARIRSVIEPTVTAFLAAKQLLDGAVPTRPTLLQRPEASETLAQVEVRLIESALIEANWLIEGPRGAAKSLGLKPSTLRSRMAKLGLRRPA